MFAAAMGVLYIREASQERRPAYVHTAGAFFVCTAVACSLVAVTISAGCSHHPVMEHIFLTGILLTETVGYGLLQIMILFKVEALLETEAPGIRLRTLLQVVGVLWGSWALLFILRVSHLIRSGPHDDATILETLVGCAAVLVFSVFTGKVVQAMLFCSSTIQTADESQGGGGAGLEQKLRMHALATGVASGASILHFSMLIVSQLPGVDASYSFVVCHIIDVLCNLACALSVSGISTFLCFMPWQIARGTDVLSDFMTAGSLAKAAAEFGTLGQPLVVAD